MAILLLLALVLWRSGGLPEGPGEPAPPPDRGAPSVPQSPSNRNEIVGQAVFVADGDTFDLRAHGRTLRVRLFGIDAPEKTQPFSNRSRQFLDDLVRDKTVRLKQKAVDEYGRIVGVAWVGNTNVNEAMVREGLAWHYRHYDSSAALTDAEARAKSARKGLWADGEPVPPWEFRRDHRRNR